MGTVIYTASSLKAFSGGLFVIALFVVLGIAGAVNALFNKRDKKIGRIVTGCAALVLLLAGGVSTFVTAQSYLTGEKTVTVHVDKKRELSTSCDNGGQCKSYNVETSDGKKYYVFGLNKPVWDELQEKSCYQFTYYPTKGLLQDFFQQDNPYENLYETTGYITRIETANCR